MLVAKETDTPDEPAAVADESGRNQRVTSEVESTQRQSQLCGAAAVFVG